MAAPVKPSPAHNALFPPLAALLFIAGFALLCIGPSRGAMIYFACELLLKLAVPTFIAAAIVIAGLLPGRLLLNTLWPGCAGRLEFNLLAAGLGLGVLGQLLLLIGALGGFNRAALLALLALLLLAGAGQLRPLAAELRAGCRVLPQRLCKPGAKIAALLLALYCALLYGNCFAPDLSFDVLEYHLGAVREFIKLGRIAHVAGNFYSGLPLQAEMLFSAGLLLEGADGAAPRLINFALLLLTLAALYALLRPAAPAAAVRLAACLLFAAHPLIFKIALAAKSDMALVFYVALSLLCWTRWLAAHEKSALLLCGVFAGLALSCKLIALGLHVVPVLIFLIALPLCLKRESRRPALIASACLLFCAGAAAACLAWLLRGLLTYGNPVFPLFSSWFESPQFSAQQYRFYLEAHALQPVAGAEYWLSALRRLDHYLPIFWLPFLALGALRSEKIPSVSLLGLFIGGHLACTTLTNNPDRFQAPLLLTLFLGLAAVYEQLSRSRPRWRPLFLIYPLWLLVWAQTLMFAALSSGAIQHLFALPGYETRTQLIARTLGEPVGRAVEFLHSSAIDRSAKILALYDAQWSLFPQPVAANTVFDRSALLRLIDESGAQSARELLGWLRQRGYRYVWVNEFELLRAIRFFTPERVLRAEFPNAFDTGELRAEINKREWSVELLKHPRLYPPLLFESQSNSKLKIYTEFVQLAARRQIFESNPPPAPRIWIADLLVELRAD